jgi:hypothetical protein
MPFPALFGITAVLGLAAWGAVAWHYIWPALRELPALENLKPILLLHAFRFLGLAFLMPGVVSPELPAAFARPVAYGDLISAILALLALATLGTRRGRWRPGFSIPSEWRTCSLVFTKEAAYHSQVRQAC